MATLFGRHDVADFARWKAAYDGFDALRRSMSVLSHGVYQAIDKPNDVTVYHEFPSVEAALAFAGSAELKEAMQRAGVVGTPAIWITNRV